LQVAAQDVIHGALFPEPDPDLIVLYGSQGNAPFLPFQSGSHGTHDPGLPESMSRVQARGLPPVAILASLHCPAVSSGSGK